MGENYKEQLDDFRRKMERRRAEIRKHAQENRYGIDLVSAWATFTVPEIPGGRSDEPLDVGTIAAKFKPVLKRGEPAPLFEARGLDGKLVKLADYRGKVVVLKWWYPWSSTETEAEAMIAAAALTKDDPDFVILSIGMDETISQAKARAERYKLPGIQAHLRQGGLPQAYTGLPSTLCIIGPDGVVIGKNLVPEDAAAEVAKVRLEKQK